MLIDGMDNNERAIGTIVVRPSIDAIAEVRVQTSNYPAEVGRTAGGVVNILTKAGTNRLSGTVYGFWRDDRFDSRDYFATVDPLLKQKQFGGSIGGPLVRDRTFVFLTDSAVGTREEHNLRHLVSNLGTTVSRDHVVPFLTTKHPLKFCLSYAERAWQEGFPSLVVLGGDRTVGPPRCGPFLPCRLGRCRSFAPARRLVQLHIDLKWNLPGG